MKKSDCIFLLIISAILFSACTSSTVEESIQPNLASRTPTPLLETPIDPAPTMTATPFPSGSAENPITLGIIYTNEKQQSPASQGFVQYLADSTDLVFQIQSFTSEIELLTAMEQGKVSLAFLQPIPYLYASESGTATVTMLSSHYGIYYYGSQFLADAAQDFTSYFDAKIGRTSDAPASVLGQFSQKTPCLVDTTSLSGYILPVGLLNESNVQFSEPILLKSHEAVIRAIYAGGICDYGVTYGLSGDPRTASAIQKDLPDVMTRVVILWQTDPIIPTLNLTISTRLPEEIREKIKTAVQDLMSRENGPALVSTMNDYSIEEFVPVGDNAYDRLRELIEASDTDLDSLLN